MKSQTLQSSQNSVTVFWYFYSKVSHKMIRFSRDFIISSPSDMMDALSFARGLCNTTPYSIGVTDGIRSSCIRF